MTDKEKELKDQLETEGESSSQAENNASIVENMELIIKENNHQDLTYFTQQSQTD
jgi:hypothetical protein